MLNTNGSASQIATLDTAIKAAVEYLKEPVPESDRLRVKRHLEALQTRMGELAAANIGLPTLSEASLAVPD